MGWQFSVNVANLLDVIAIVGLRLGARWWHTPISPLLASMTPKEVNHALWQIRFEAVLYLEIHQMSERL